MALPEDDLYRDVLFDSVATRTGFARACSAFAVGHDDLVLHPDQPRLRRLDCAAIMQLKRQQHLAVMEDAAEIDPRTCLSAGAVACTHARTMQCTIMYEDIELTRELK